MILAGIRFLAGSSPAIQTAPMDEFVNHDDFFQTVGRPLDLARQKGDRKYHFVAIGIDDDPRVTMRKCRIEFSAGFDRWIAVITRFEGVLIRAFCQLDHNVCRIDI